MVDVAKVRQAREAEALALWARRGGLVCKACKAKVTFVHSQRGKSMILDAEPDWRKGNVFINGRDGQPVGVVWANDALLAENREQGVPFHTVHQATCPYAHEFRRSK